MGPKHFGPLIKAISVEMQKRINNHLADVSKDLPRLTSTQLEVLGYLYHHPQQTIYQSDLEQVFNLSRPTINGIVKRLREIHTIEMKPSLQDRRYKFVQLTPETRREMMRQQPRFEADIHQLEAQLFRGFTEEEIQAINDALSRMLANLKEWDQH